MIPCLCWEFLLSSKSMRCEYIQLVPLMFGGRTHPISQSTDCLDLMDYKYVNIITKRKNNWYSIPSPPDSGIDSFLLSLLLSCCLRVRCSLIVLTLRTPNCLKRSFRNDSNWTLAVVPPYFSVVALVALLLSAFAWALLVCFAVAAVE